GVEAVIGESWFELEDRRVFQHQRAMQLPPGIAPEAGAVAGVVVTRGLALRPVAEIMQPYHAVGAGHADQRAEIDAEPFEPQRAVEACMDQAAVHADRMPEAQGDRAGHDEQRECTPRERHWSK